MNTIFTSRDGRQFADPTSRDRYEAVLTEQASRFNSGVPIPRDPLNPTSPWSRPDPRPFSIGGTQVNRGSYVDREFPGMSTEGKAALRNKLFEKVDAGFVSGNRVTFGNGYPPGDGA